jgi:hypothetical protein
VELVRELLHSISLFYVISWPDCYGRGEATLESARTQQSPLLHVAGLDGGNVVHWRGDGGMVHALMTHVRSIRKRPRLWATSCCSAPYYAKFGSKP